LSKNCQHNWIVPSWYQYWNRNKVGLPMICEKCGRILLFEDIDPPTFEQLYNMMLLRNIEIGDVKYEHTLIKFIIAKNCKKERGIKK